MNIIKNDYWSTPVWEIDTGLDEYFNLTLENELKAVKAPNNDVWSYNSTRILELKNKIFESLDTVLSSYFTEQFPNKLCFLNGWVNAQQPGEDLALHSHGGAWLVSTYYVRVPKNSGDLLLVDPRGGVDWDLTHEGNTLGVKYRRITPTPGKLVIFPGYVMHSVETNKSNENRISVATNIQNIVTAIHLR